jgi:hypothetical protein
MPWIALPKKQRVNNTAKRAALTMQAARYAFIRIAGAMIPERPYDLQKLRKRVPDFQNARCVIDHYGHH